MEFVLPGDPIGDIIDYVVGEGVYISENKIYAKYAGMKKVQLTSNEKPIIKVIKSSHLIDERIIPTVGSICVCRVVKLVKNMCYVSILSCNGYALKHNLFNGIIKRESIWSHQVEGSSIQKAFQVNDIIVARIISIMDSHRSDISARNVIFLSTSEKELGVIHAISKSYPEQVLIPFSWKEMANHATGLIEYRKVAKIRIYENQF